MYWVAQGFLTIEGQVPRNDKRIRSNVLNRLIIILVEDISILEAHLIQKSYDVLERLRYTEGEVTGEVDISELVELIYEYCRAKKSRLGSHVNNFYQYPTK
jgi:hypothetical protein